MAETEYRAPMDYTAAPLAGNLTELSGLHDDSRQSLLSGSQVLHYPAGSKLVQHNMPADRLMIVLRGVIKIYETASNGREITLYRISSGQICALSLARLLYAPANCAEAVAEEDVRLLSVPRDLFEQLAGESPDFCGYLMEAMAHCLTDLMQLTAEITFHNLDMRLAQLIRRRCVHSPAINLCLTHQEIANELGTTREVISRLLKDFEKAGYISLGRGKIQVLAMDELDRIGGQRLEQGQLRI